MDTYLASQGYSGLFALAFFASTLIPIGSEWLLVLMLLAGNDPVATVAVAAVGNYLGGCTTWAVGVWGGPFLVRRILRIDSEVEAKAVRLFHRFGVWSLLLSWLPVIGDSLCLAGGILHVSFIRFSLPVFAGKLARYGGVAWVTLRSMGSL